MFAAAMGFPACGPGTADPCCCRHAHPMRILLVEDETDLLSSLALALREERYAFSEEDLRPYFSLPRVLEARSLAMLTH